MAWSVNKNNPTEAELARLNSSELDIFELENDSKISAGEVIWGEIKTRFFNKESDTNIESAVEKYEQVQARSILDFSSIETRQISDTEYEELPSISKNLWANFPFLSLFAVFIIMSFILVPILVFYKLETKYVLLVVGTAVVCLLVATLTLIRHANKIIIKKDSQVTTGKVVHFFRIETSDGESNYTSYYVAVAIEDGERYVRHCAITQKEWDALKIGDPVFLVVRKYNIRANLIH